MNKIILSLAGVLAAIAFAPEASAVPAFARQTGMACSACHFQKFPVLNKFGQAFKASGYTMMGAQAKIEGEELSIPATLNTAVLFTANYTKDARTPRVAANSGTGANEGMWTVPGELALFIAGRVGENAGVFMESNMAVGNGGNGGIAVTFKIPMMFDVGDYKLGLVPFTNDGGSGGPAYGYELSSTGVQDNIRWSLDQKDIASARIYAIPRAGFAGATGMAFVAKNDMGYINYTPFTPNFLQGNLTNNGKVFGDAKWLRIAVTPSVAGWDMHIGYANLSGKAEVVGGIVASAGLTINGTTYAPAYLTSVSYKANALDFQAQGQVGGNDMSLYAGYAKSPKSTATAPNALNASTAGDLSAVTVGADYTAIPHTLTVGAAYRSGKTGVTSAETDKGLMVQATYDIYQNMALTASYATYTGTAYNTGGSKAVGGVGQGTGKSAYALTLEAAF